MFVTRTINLKNTVRTIMQMQRFDISSRLIGLGLSDSSSSPSGPKWSVASYKTTLAAGSRTTQLLEPSPQSIRVTIHGQQVTSLQGEVLLLCRGPRGLYGNLCMALDRHTCPDPHLGSWNFLPHQAHIAPSEPMSSIDQQVSGLGSFPTFSSPLSPL